MFRIKLNDVTLRRQCYPSEAGPEQVHHKCRRGQNCLQHSVGGGTLTEVDSRRRLAKLNFLGGSTLGRGLAGVMTNVGVGVGAECIELAGLQPTGMLRWTREKPRRRGVPAGLSCSMSPLTLCHLTISEGFLHTSRLIQ